VRHELDSTRFGLEGEDRSAVHRFSHEAMHTIFEVHVAHPDPAYAGQAAQACFALVDRLEQELSRFIANSDVSRINRLARGAETRVSAWTIECLAAARGLYELTGGAFDVSIGTGLDQLELSPEELTVRARTAGIGVDLGGIGKGYAIDRMAELLAEWDLASVLVHGGFSSVLALGSPPSEQGWPLTLHVPQGGELVARLSARQVALSASGVQKGAHILDARTGQAVSGRAAWVALDLQRLEPEDARRSAGAIAEGLSTAFMVLSEVEIGRICESIPGAEAWLLLDAADTANLIHFRR
jgi:thiamine biosynthesis lipoprotein